MAGGRDGHIPVVRTVGGDAPGIPTRTGCRTGGRFHDLIGMVLGAQITDGNITGGSTTLAAGAHQGTGGTGRRVLGHLIGIAMTGCIGVVALIAVLTGRAGVGGIALCRTGGAGHLAAVAVGAAGGAAGAFAGRAVPVVTQGAASGAATAGTLLSRSTGSSCIVMGNLGNRFRIAISATGLCTSVGLDAGGSTSSLLGHGRAVLVVITSKSNNQVIRVGIIRELIGAARRH